MGDDYDIPATASDEQKINTLLDKLQDVSELQKLTPDERTVLLCRVCRLQQKEILRLQEIPKNIGLGLKVIAGIGGLVAFVISTAGGILAIRGYFKG